MKRAIKSIVFCILFMLLCMPAYAASNSDTMFVHMLESMDEFAGSGYNTKAFIYNQKPNATLIYGDERYYDDSVYKRGLLISSVWTSETQDIQWTYNPREACGRLRTHVEKLSEFSQKKGQAVDEGPLPVDTVLLKKLNSRGKWHIFGHDSAYMYGKTKSSDNMTFEWEMLPFYIEQSEMLVDSSDYIYFRVIVDSNNGMAKNCHEYVVGDPEESGKLFSYLLKLNKNIDSWDLSSLKYYAK